MNGPIKVNDLIDTFLMTNSRFLCDYDIINYINEHRLYEIYGKQELETIAECIISIHEGFRAFNHCLHHATITIPDNEFFEDQIDKLIDRELKEIDNVNLELVSKQMASCLLEHYKDTLRYMAGIVLTEDESFALYEGQS